MGKTWSGENSKGRHQKDDWKKKRQNRQKKCGGQKEDVFDRQSNRDRKDVERERDDY